MTENSWSPAWVVAWLVWGVATLLLVGSILVWDDRVSDHLGRAGLFGGMVATILTARAIHARSARLIRAAYDVGRETRAPVSTLR